MWYFRQCQGLSMCWIAVNMREAFTIKPGRTAYVYNKHSLLYKMAISSEVLLQMVTLIKD